VLVGIQIPPGGKADLEKFLEEIQYPFADETDNLVYKNFMTSADKAKEVLAA
jgi:threonine dehydratase